MSNQLLKPHLVGDFYLDIIVYMSTNKEPHFFDTTQTVPGLNQMPAARNCRIQDTIC